MPTTREILKKVKKIEIATSRLVTESLAGQYHSVFKGRGMSFDSVRVYAPGDDIRTIDWNVSARNASGDIFVKQYVEERELTVVLVVDLSASGDFGSIEQTKRELAAEVAAVLAFSAIKNNDRVGLVLFTDRIEHTVPPKKGRGHVLRVILDLLEYEAAGRGTRLDVACDYLGHIAKRKAVVFLISDFLGDDWERSLAVASRKHDVVPLVIADKLESELPDLGLVPMEDAETGELLYFDTTSAAARRQLAERFAVQSARRDAIFRRHGLEPIAVQVGKPYTRALMNYFRLRAKRQ